MRSETKIMNGELVLQLEEDGQHCLLYILDKEQNTKASIKVTRAALTKALSELLTEEIKNLGGSDNKTHT
jgi:hypothetical protein